jgi:DNA-binding transcriptional ArsR family regulator
VSIPLPDGEARAGAVFDALADGSRRAVLRGVAERGPITATELAASLPISRQAVSKHLAVLHAAGLVEPERAGRELRFAARLAPMHEAGQWLDTTGAAWDDRLRRLEARAESRARDAHQPPGRD